MSTNSKALKSGIWYTVSNFLVKGIGFISTPIFTRLLTHEEFGIFSNFSSWLAIFTIFVTWDLHSTFVSARFDFENEFDEYIFSVLSLSTLSAAIWFVVLTVFNDFAQSFLNLNNTYIRCMMLYLVFQPAVQMFQTRERYRFEYKKTVFLSLLISIGTVALSVLLVVFLESKIDGRVFGSVIPTIIVGLIIYILIGIKGKRIKLKYWKYALPICLPYIPHLLSMTLLNSMDRVMITHICGDEKTALYSLAYNCGYIVTMLLSSLNNAFSPWLAVQLHSKNYNQIRIFTKKYIVMFLAMATGIMLIAPELLLILGGESYLEAKYVITPVSMGCIMQFMYIFFVDVEQYNKKTVGMAIASISAAGINYVLNMWLIPQTGYLAAAYTTLAGYFVLFVLHMIIATKYECRNFYDYRFMWISIIAALVVMVLITLTYNNDIVRYCVIAAFVCILAILLNKHRADVKRVISMFKSKN